MITGYFETLDVYSQKPKSNPSSENQNPGISSDLLSEIIYLKDFGSKEANFKNVADFEMGNRQLANHKKAEIRMGGLMRKLRVMSIVHCAYSKILLRARTLKKVKFEEEKDEEQDNEGQDRNHRM